MAVVAYPESFNEMINLAIRFNDSFKRLKYAQKKPGKKVRNFSYRKKRDPDIID
jgi:hypothetical protein